jgi:hypothetical protein
MGEGLGTASLCRRPLAARRSAEIGRERVDCTVAGPRAPLLLASTVPLLPRFHGKSRS